ncbi:phosphoribosylanthranilate isomerase [Paenibacillus sp. P96]|uniref:N-(5'-phosphoribosyl)anthranilate isomerase n=1 Tax=Paenibacillus zeirhizosphaerae TaxID=2987519 RepID=A0ABT9FPN9_9BACL|nr:phosphoribosylanthranilate isomerase [Paenibacillus sp. P96]MDP4096639.1 phosphoribosylanthranilate isomerase [Paenibacillus sp. P96]
MTETALKICGLQSVEVLKSMMHLNIDYIGFIFAESRRRISPERAVELIQVLGEWETSRRPRSVGVFVNPDIDQLQKVMNEAPLDVIQLHGQESPAFCSTVKERFGKMVFKALPVLGGANEAATSAERLDPYGGYVDSFLLDTYDPHYGGGSGRTFAWEAIPAYHERARVHGIPLFIAGGLTPDNVAGLISAYGPEGLDVSSGVETDGVKDIAKITAFVERVKRHDTTA